MKSERHAPWSDVCDLITFSSVKDADGYEELTEVKHRMFCNWEDGVSQSEFYLSDKAGMRASAQVELHKVDLIEAWPSGMGGERFVDFNGVRYRVLRNFPQSFDTQTLILTEVIR